MTSHNVRQMIELTGYQLDEPTATKILSHCSNRLDLAMDEFFNFPEKYLVQYSHSPKVSKKSSKSNHSNSSNSSSSSSSPASSLFKKYDKLDPEKKDLILANGTIQLFEDLEIDPYSDRRVLIFSWKTFAQESCQFKKSEFLEGLRNLNADNLEDIKNKLDSINQLLDQSRYFMEFKKLYLFTFEWARDKKCKNMSVEEAVGYWRILFNCGEQEEEDDDIQVVNNHFSLIDDFLRFVEGQGEKGTLR